MRIAVYAICYNEVFILPFFMQHYRPLVDKIIIYDNESTDGSKEAALCWGADEVRTFSTNNEIREDIQRQIRNNCWKESRNFDWVFVVDMDEFIYHTNLRDYLKICTKRGTTICVPQGFQMIGTELPKYNNTQIYKQIQNGAPCPWYCKPVVFNPNAIKEINLNPGSHLARPLGTIAVDAQNELKLLHFHWLSLESVIEKNVWRNKRLSQINIDNRWGLHYNDSAEQSVRRYRKLQRNAVNIYDHIPDLDKKFADMCKRKIVR